MMTEVVQAVQDTCKDLMNGIHTAMPARVTKYENGRVDAQISGKFYLEGTAYDYPLITGCPVIAGGGIAYPINVGDACLLIFTEQSLSEWITGTSTNNNEKWSLTNAVAICGLNKSETALQAQANSSGSAVVGDLSSTGDVSVESGSLSVQGMNVKEHIDTAESDIDTLDGEVESLGDRMDSAESAIEGIGDVDAKISTHNSSSTAHSDMRTRLGTAESNIATLQSYQHFVNVYQFGWDYNGGVSLTYSIDIPCGQYFIQTHQNGSWADSLDLLGVTPWDTFKTHISGADYFTVTNHSSGGTKANFDISGNFCDQVRFLKIW